MIEAFHNFAHMSKVSNTIHIVINTYMRKMTITHDNRNVLYRFIYNLLTTRDCYLYRIGGIPNHIHLLVDLSPKIALSDLVRDIKKESSRWMKSSGYFPNFESWGKEYFAFGISKEHIHAVIDYIKSQPEHHNIQSFEDEIKSACSKEGVEWNDYLLT